MVRNLLTWLISKPIRGFVAVSSLNAIDAVATYIAIRMGTGREANPLIDAIGLPTKSSL